MSLLIEEKTIHIVIFITLLVGIIAIIVFYFSDKNRILRTVRKIHSKKIGLVKENEYIKIIGNAHGIDPSLISPIGKRHCVYYQIKVEQKKSNGNGSSWHTIIKEEKSIPFIIESDGEKAIVEPPVDSKAKIIYLIKDVKYRSGTWNDAPTYLENYLNAKGEKSTGFLGLNKTIRYQEGVIEIGEEIVVLGKGNWKKTEHNFDTYSSETLCIHGDLKNKLMITDDPKALQHRKK